MTTLFRLQLVICSVALLAACGGGAQDDIVIRTDSEQAVVADKVTGPVSPEAAAKTVDVESRDKKPATN